MLRENTSEQEIQGVLVRQAEAGRAVLHRELRKPSVSGN